jgi:hypothetical protein
MRSMGRLLAAAFILSCCVGFAIDLLLLNYQPLARGFFWPVYSGTLGTATLAARSKTTRHCCSSASSRNRHPITSPAVFPRQH